MTNNTSALCAMMRQVDFGMSHKNRDQLAGSLAKLRQNTAIEWQIIPGLYDYPTAVLDMQKAAQEIAAGQRRECVWLVEHPALYTAGTSAASEDLITPQRFPVHHTGRGGQYTYHGPGQRVAYVMLNLKQRGSDVRTFVAGLEQWLISSLAEFNVRGERRDDRVGVWVKRPENGRDVEDKIAAIGIRVSRWVSYHGISLNIEPDLEHFSGIVPCGVSQHGVTSLVDLGLPVTMDDADIALKAAFFDIFGGEPVTPDGHNDIGD